MGRELPPQTIKAAVFPALACCMHGRKEEETYSGTCVAFVIQHMLFFCPDRLTFYCCTISACMKWFPSCCNLFLSLSSHLLPIPTFYHRRKDKTKTHIHFTLQQPGNVDLYIYFWYFYLDYFYFDFICFIFIFVDFAFLFVLDCVVDILYIFAFVVFVPFYFS